MIYLRHFLRTSPLKIAPKGEELICSRFATYMREMTLTGRCKTVWFHVSNEGSAPGKHVWGARQRNMGKFAGVSDYVFLGDRFNLALEVKDGNKPLQPTQQEFKRWCEDCKVPYVLAKSYEESVQFVIDHQIVIPTFCG